MKFRACPPAALAVMIAASSAWAQEATHGTDIDCRARLSALGAKVDASTKIPAPTLPACATVEPVSLKSLKGLPGSPDISLASSPVLACAMAERLGSFLLDVASPAAGQLFGSAISSVDVGPGYTCRPRNNQPGAKVSSHGQGLAVDIASIRLGSGRVLLMGQPADAQEKEFVDHLARRACVHFNTVLGIGSDQWHMNNIHIDIEPRGRDGRTKFCQ